MTKAKINKTEQRLRGLVKGETYAYTDGFEKYNSEWSGNPRKGVFTGRVEHRRRTESRFTNFQSYWMAELEVEVLVRGGGTRKAKVWRESRQLFMTWAEHEKALAEKAARRHRKYALGETKRRLKREMRLQVADLLRLPREESKYGLEEPAVGEIGIYRSHNDIGVEANVPEHDDPEKAVIASVSIQVDDLSLPELTRLVEFVRDEIWAKRPETPKEN